MKSCLPSIQKLLVICAILTGASLVGCNKPVEKSEVVRPVLTQRIALGSTAEQTVYTGEVRARHEADLAFRIGGKIISRAAEIGSSVKKGMVLAKLDPQDVRLGADAARSQVAAADTEFNFAKAELERNKDLLEKNFISKAVYDAKLNSYNSAQAKLAAARAQSAVSANQSNYASLIADQDGVITAVSAEAGQVIAAGQPIIKLARQDEKDVVINVPESRLAEIKKMDDMAIRLWAKPEKIYRGKLREVSPGADAATRTYAAKISIADAGDIQLGMTANVLSQQNGTNKTALIPLAALYQQEGQPAVWIVDAKTSKVELRPVQTGAYREDGVVVLAGLMDGDVIVVAGVHKLVPGQLVRLDGAAPVANKEANKS